MLFHLPDFSGAAKETNFSQDAQFFWPEVGQKPRQLNFGLLIRNSEPGLLIAKISENQTHVTHYDVIFISSLQISIWRLGRFALILEHLVMLTSICLVYSVPFFLFPSLVSMAPSSFALPHRNSSSPVSLSHRDVSPHGPNINYQYLPDHVFSFCE